MADNHLAQLKLLLRIAQAGDSKREAYKAAAKVLVAYRNENPRKWRMAAASYCNTSTATLDKLVQWHDSGHKAETPFLMDTEATKRAARSHAKAIMADPNEAAKVFAALDTEGKAALVKVVIDSPSGRQHVEHELEERHPATSSNPTNVREPKFPLLHRIEGDRLKLEAAAELMAGHWHDGRHDVSDEEQRLVRDSMAEAVIKVEQTVTSALRDEIDEVRTR